ncbi:MAG TPA: long-chain fatty acid--CoA ligase, partial [Gemmatimonadales bacterium]|nr:long-chain fatty acid--CoA ligase [Gemmatimonadales bacterium]
MTRRRSILGGIGRAIYGVAMRVVDELGQPVPGDGQTVGHIQARGHRVCAGHFKGDGEPVTDGQGWLWTGDLGTIDDQGFLRLTDRAKDVIKSGGEWISSLELETLAMGHPAVAEAAAVGVAHPRWGERRVLMIVPRGAVTREALIDWLRPKVPRWWLPDDVVVVAAL